MSVELGGLLAVMGTVFVGNPLSLDPGFSIGGESTAVSNLLGNLLGLLGKVASEIAITPHITKGFHRQAAGSRWLP
jgi:energy-converting hydrogenase Eha subunit B